MNKKIIPFLISILLLGGLIYLSGIENIINIISNINIIYLFLGIMVVITGALIRTARWKYLLGKVSADFNFIKTFQTFTAGLFISSLTPGKVGDPIRSVIYKKVSGKPIGKTLPSIFVERIFDITIMILFSLIGLLTIIPTNGIFIYFVVAILFYMGLFSFGLFVILSEKRTKATINIFQRFFSFIPQVKKLKSKINKFSDTLHKSFMLYKNKRTIFVTVILSIIIWTIEGITLFLMFSSLNVGVTLESTIFIMPLVTLIAVLTFLPSGLGSGEIIHVLIFTSMFDITMAEVTTTILLSRLLFYVIYSVIGSTFLFNFKK